MNAASKQPKPEVAPLAMVLLPTVACVLSVVPTAWLRVLGGLESSWPLASVPAATVLRAMGATSLVAGHTLSCRNKPSLSRADACYLSGTSLLTVAFGGALAASATGVPSLAPPALTVSAAGLAMLGCFAILARGALQPNVTAVTRSAVAAALAGSTCLVLAGAMASIRLPLAVTASLSFLFANSVLLLLLARAKTPTRVAFPQACKVLGSFLLASANGIALKWPGSLVITGVLPKEILALASLASPATSASFLGAVAAGVYAAAYYL